MEYGVMGQKALLKIAKFEFKFYLHLPLFYEKVMERIIALMDGTQV